jgi:hypothetical protein
VSICAGDEAFEGGDPRFVLFDQIGGDRIFVERAGLEPLDPDADQIARQTVSAVFSHGLSSFESPAARSIAKLNPVRPKGPIPCNWLHVTPNQLLWNRPAAIVHLVTLANLSGSAMGGAG